MYHWYLQIKKRRIRFDTLLWFTVAKVLDV